MKLAGGDNISHVTLVKNVNTIKNGNNGEALEAEIYLLLYIWWHKAVELNGFSTSYSETTHDDSYSMLCPKPNTPNLNNIPKY